MDPFASSYAAFSCGSADVTRFLIEHGADTTAWANDGQTALHLVAEVGSMEIVRIVVEHGAQLGSSDNRLLRYYLFVLGNTTVAVEPNTNSPAGRFCRKLRMFAL